MMMMGRDVRQRRARRPHHLVRWRKEVEAHVESAHAGGASHVGNQNPTANAKPIVVTLLEDGTLSGEMMTSAGPRHGSAKR